MPPPTDNRPGPKPGFGFFIPLLFFDGPHNRNWP
jgi:hypothetical protein